MSMEIQTIETLLTLNGSPISFLSAEVSLPFLEELTAYTASYTDPATFFANYAGTYTPTSDTLRVGWSDAGWYDTLNFRITSFAISVTGTPLAPVPEPSTYGAMAGAAALGFAWWRRRSRARAGSAA